MATPEQAPARRPADRARLVGVDLARAVAVAGMMTVHVLPEDAPGVPGALYDLAHGRASGLFAVLAGLSLGLTTRRTGPGGRDRAAARVSIAVRGLLIAVLGLLLVDAGSRIAIILMYYGVAFLVVLPVLFLPLRALAPLAGAWFVLGPLVGAGVRGAYGLTPEWEQPTLLSLAAPGHLLQTLLLTGYYPVLGWTAYLLLGLALSRLDLRSPRTAVGVLALGAVLAAGSWLVAGLAAAAAPLDVSAGDFHGTAPTGSWWWQTAVEPHSGTPLDLLHTAGSGLVVLGALLLLPAAVTRFLRPVAAFGALPLTIYTAHVVALAAHPGDTPGLLGAHVLVGVAFATLWRSLLGRGPLERVVGQVATGAAELVRGPVDVRR